MANNFLKIYNGLSLTPRDTDPTNPQEGDVQFADGTARPKGIWEFVDGSWRQTGGGGGGGLDIFHSQDLETLGTGDFTSGLNATYKTAGSFGGTLADETSVQIAGDRSAKYTAGASSTNDWFDVETITLDTKQKSETIGIVLWADMSSFSVDVEFVVWDNTNSEKLTGSLDVLVADEGKVRYSFSAFIPSTTASISYGFHMTNAPVNGESFLVDDFEFSTNPFVFKDLLVDQMYDIEQRQNTMLDITAGEYRYDLGIATVKTGGSALIVEEDDAANTRTKFVALRRSMVNIHVYSGEAAADQIGRIVLYNSAGVAQKTINGDRVASAGFTWTANAFIILEVGEFFVIGGNQPLDNTAVRLRMVFTAQAQTEHVITPSTVARQYSEADGDFTVTSTGTNWVTDTAILVPYLTGDGKWRLKGNIEGNLDTTTAHVISISGVIFSSDLIQAVTVQANVTNWAMGVTSEGTGDINLFAGATATGWRIAFDMALDSKPTWADPVSTQYLAAIPLTRYQTKFLSSNASSTGVMSDLTFSNLNIGTTYRVNLHLSVAQGASSVDDARIRVSGIHDGTTIFIAGDRVRTTTSIINGLEGNADSSRVFMATNTTITFDITTITGDVVAAGTGSGSGSYAQLEELPTHVSV